MIALAEPLEPFESEAEKIAYCRAFLEQRGYGVSQSLPTQKPSDREPQSIAYILNSAKRPRETQEQLIGDAINALGSSVPKFAGAFFDDYSAAGRRLADRPGGRKLLNTLDRGDHLWIAQYDLLGRWSIHRICKELRARRVLIPPGHSQGRGWCDERIKKVLAYHSLPFPDCPEGATRIDDLLDMPPAQSPIDDRHAAADQQQ